MSGRCDFHTHTVLTDGELLPVESIRRAKVLGYKAIAITEHIGAEDPVPLIKRLRLECEMGSEGFGVQALWGVEITHVPPRYIPQVAERARKAGARIIVVHGETLAEPVAKGTNWAAVNSDIDILAHPGLLSSREAGMAAQKGVFLEITSHPGHAYTNGHVARISTDAAALLLINSDSHSSRDMMDQEMATRIGLGAGLHRTEVGPILNDNPKRLLERSSDD
jgi:histidinol phosphatase-like PHP family hydrolase